MVYNHEKYLAQCLDGIVMQKTLFPFEALIHDDASTDGSAAIIRSYAEKYPEIIKPIWEQENRFSKHDGSIRRVIAEATAPSTQYYAYCEGDDYWTDPLKLQKQVNYLDTHPDIIICSHTYYNNNESTGKSEWPFKTNYFKQEESITVYRFDRDNYWKRWAVQPLTCMYRRGDYLGQIPYKKYKEMFDVIFFYYVLGYGKGAMLQDNMGVYRIHNNGLWSSLSTEMQYQFRYKESLSIYQIEHDKRILYDIEQSAKRLSIFYLKAGKDKKAIDFWRRYRQDVPFWSTFKIMRKTICRVPKIYIKRLVRKLSTAL